MNEANAVADAMALRAHVHGGTWFKSEGEGDAVVLIHGVGLDHAMWDAQVAALKDRFRIVTYDMLGHGRSAQPPDQRQLGDFVRQLHQLLMNLDLASAAIVGFSMGGLVAREFAAQYPEMTSKLVLMNTVFRRSAEQQAAVMARYEASARGELETGIDAALERWFSGEFADANPQVIATVRRRLRGNDPQGYLNAYRVFASHADPMDNLPVSCPALVVTGAGDTGSTPEMARALAAAIAGARLEILPGLRHLAPVEGAAAVNELLGGFLAAPV